MSPSLFIFLPGFQVLVYDFWPQDIVNVVPRQERVFALYLKDY